MTPGAVRAVDAATVVLARHGVPTGTPWQCFMVRRHVKSEFAADVFVFPGGKVDEADRTADIAAVSVGHPGPPDILEVPVRWRALRLAAIRELFEEAGVLIARHRDGGMLHVDGENRERVAGWRKAIQAGELSLVELALRENLIYPLDSLHAISRWITPEPLPRRFDTWFFVTALPHGQEPQYDAHETTAGVWISPAEALSRYHGGTFPLVFATEKHLERLGQYPSVEALISAVSRQDLEPVMPRIVEVEGTARFLLPGDEGY